MAAKLSVLVKSTMFAFDELKRAYGLGRTLKILGEVGKRNASGLPWKGLPAPEDAREAETRAELTPAVNLYQVLCSEVPEAEAFAVARGVILNSSLLHLRSIYPDFRGGDFLKVIGGDTGRAGARLGQDFAFADTRVLEVTREKAAFDVVACRIPGVLAKVGADRLASIFCEVDFIYFPIYAPEVKLTRAKTLVHGGDVCDFRLEWKV